jgi:hypothetical protein
MMKRAVLAIAASLTICTPAFATTGEMSVASFLAKADALRAKGPMALFSSDFKLLKQEGEAAGAHYRERLMQERAAGKPSSCAPKGVRPSNDQFIAFLRSYPEAARPRTPMREAMAGYFIKTYPCN